MENFKIYNALKDLVAVINSALNNTKPKNIENYELAYQIAKNNGVQSLFSMGLKGVDNVNEKVKKIADESYNAETLQLSMQEYYANEIFSLLKEKGIKFMPLKGFILRDYYPKKEMRNSTDIDFYYDKNSRGELEKVLTDLGFKFSRRGQSHEVWKLNTVTIEPHFELFLDGDADFEKHIETSFDNLIVKDKTEYSFKLEDFYLYMVYHAYKHIMESALSLRTVIDFYIFNKNAVYDRTYVDSCLEKLGLKTFELKIRKLYSVWFDDETEDEESIALSVFIAKNSLFGDISNSLILRNDLKSKEKTNNKKVFLKRIFPSYKELKGKYSSLKTPILYPIFWIVRLVTLIFKRPKYIKKHYNAIKNIDNNRIAEIENVRKILNI